MKKIFAILILAIVVAAGAIYYGFFWQAPMPTANPESQLTYFNKDYGFKLTLPASWTGYSIIKGTWEGHYLDDNLPKMTPTGPTISIRNPNWTEKKPWQDIRIMVFTPEQWSLIDSERMSVSAAPVGPQKIGENAQYVFALPPRWVGFTDALGQAEAQNIVKTFRVVLGQI